MWQAPEFPPKKDIYPPNSLSKYHIWHILHHMTDEEYDALDEVSANYIMTKAEAFHKTPSEIIGEMVREKIAVNL